MKTTAQRKPGRPLLGTERMTPVQIMLSPDIREAAAHEAVRSGRTLSEVYRDWFEMGRAASRQGKKK